jgi:hypothetical protein
MIKEEWQQISEELFGDFPEERILKEAHDWLKTVNYKIEWDNHFHVIIPEDVELALLRRSFHQTPNMEDRIGYLTFEIAIGPHYTSRGHLDSIPEYGILRLMYGLDGTFYDDTFELSLLQEPKEIETESRLAVAAEEREEYRTE